ncbi:DUF2145 domain-containing protein [uncultured Herbaspirillum sp.]|uniref:DUF2145 domain-containing protein n=1 Tax=uncultured Herbaspirillum sp. TaxID=160236 RepID=UPI00258AFA5B|nr:DUF2145 domain-containing protein [uncultured Herbaspirillum sp.]
MNLSWRRAWLQALLCLLCMGGMAVAHGANLFVYCDQTLELSAAQKNRLLLLADTVRDELQRSGEGSAIISRSAINLDRFQIRYSHAGLAVRNDSRPHSSIWRVRQLFYRCEKDKPDIFDQGIAGFLLDNDSASMAYVSLVFVPGTLGLEMRRAALDDTLSSHLLGQHYSANAYPFSTQFQNCNQWLMEMLAFAWGQLSLKDDVRAAAQQWLRQSDYRPTDIEVQHDYLMWASHFIPLLHDEDHPAVNLEKNLYQVTMPASIESFIHRRDPESYRVELCMNEEHIVVHPGWSRIADGCVAASGDRVLPVN